MTAEKLCMKEFLKVVCLSGAIATASAFAAAPADAPAGSMGMCKDGTYSTATDKKGACSGHKGVKEWYADAPPTKPPVSERAAAPPPSTSATPMSTAPATPAPAGRSSSSPQPVAGGGAGKVWANTSTKVYHCQGAKYYGTTKHGEYMSEAEAKSKGYHADHGKACA
jgi:hypothetical protein